MYFISSTNPDFFGYSARLYPGFFYGILTSLIRTVFLPVLSFMPFRLLIFGSSPSEHLPDDERNMITLDSSIVQMFY